MEGQKLNYTIQLMLMTVLWTVDVRQLDSKPQATSCLQTWSDYITVQNDQFEHEDILKGWIKP